MKNRNNHIAILQAQGEAAFSSFHGDNGKNFLGVDQGMSAMSGGNGGQGNINIEPFQKEYIFDIENTDPSYELAAPLFSALEGIAVPYNSVEDTLTGNTPHAAKGIVISPLDYTHNELKEIAKNSPFVIQGHRYIFTSTAQLKKKWEVRRKNGPAIEKQPYYPQHKRTLSQQITDELEDPFFRLQVDAGTTLFVIVAPLTSITIAFKVATQTQVSNVLQGVSAVTKYGSTYNSPTRPSVF